MRRLFSLCAILLSLWLSAVPPAWAQSEEPPQADAASSGTNIHIVARGETMFSIARQYGTTVDAVTHANGLPDPRRIYTGQRLVIPSGAQTAGTATNAYVMRAGDTLPALAKRFGTTWRELVRLNQFLSPHVTYQGQVIQVPAVQTSTGTDIHSPVAEGALHTVQPNDTLFRLGIRYGISQWSLATKSQIANPALIYPGQELIVPGDGATLLPAPLEAIEVTPLPVAQGQSLVIAVRTTAPVSLRGRLFEHEFSLAEENGVYYGLVGVHVFKEPGLYDLQLSAIDDQGHQTTVTTGVVVEEKRYGYERIDLPASRTNLLDPAVIAADRDRLQASVQTFTQARQWTGPFQQPCAGVVSSYYGTRRSYNGGPYTSYHSGLDFRAPTGTPVYAATAGTVVLAEPLAIYGNMVVLDHGWGLLTGYAHLSEIDVVVGQQVTAEDVIGKVGNTGSSTGSHLHWETWVGGISVSGRQWMQESYPWTARPAVAMGG
jgi:murein DD-endopeptidase MepM/ murein hydrolase activator NlpD